MLGWNAHDSTLVSNDAFLPSQRPDQAVPVSGSRRLLLRVFQQTWEDYFKYHRLRRNGRHGKHFYEDAQEWIDSDATFIYSFRWTCGHLGWDADWVRRTLHEDAISGKVRQALRQMNAGRGSSKITA